MVSDRSKMRGFNKLPSNYHDPPSNVTPVVLVHPSADTPLLIALVRSTRKRLHKSAHTGPVDYACLFAQFVLSSLFEEDQSKLSLSAIRIG